MKFERYSISETLKKNLSKMGYKRPTDIQFKAIPHVLKREDVLAIAQTGTGKTAAFAIPVTHILNERKRHSRSQGIRCIVMVPTRELALQITEEFEKISRNTRVKVFGLFGGVEQDPQIAKLQEGVDILVSTPGRMFDLASQGHLRLEKIEILILDEADHMLALGFIKDIQDLLRHIPRNRQTLFFSATINEKIKKLAHSLVENPIRIQVSPKDPVSRNVDHSLAYVEMDDKRFFLERLIKEFPEKKILVFVRTKVRAERVCKAMERVDIESQTLHGDKEQKDRQKVLNQFKKGLFKVLIATDVSARGIDIPDVDYVVNYDLPEPSENYVHRVGRTGRGTKRGKAISFCSESEKEILDHIEGFLGTKINMIEVNQATYTETIESSQENDTDWKGLMAKASEEGKRRKKKKR